MEEEEQGGGWGRKYTDEGGLTNSIPLSEPAPSRPQMTKSVEENAVLRQKRTHTLQTALTPILC